MSERFTKKDAERAFERLCELMGTEANPPMVRADTGWAYERSGWILDCNHTYGGYVVGAVEAGTTGQASPFGTTRRSARDFWQMVWDITRAFELRESAVKS